MTLEWDWTLERFEDVALVELRLRNGGPVDRRVRVRNELSGPVLPPRTGGAPDSGWDDDGYAGIVPAGATRALGYAVPTADPVEPPVAVDDEGRATGDPDPPPTVDAAVRALGDPAPPRDAVPSSGSLPPTDERRGASAGCRHGAEGKADDADADRTTADPPDRGAVEADPDADRDFDDSRAFAAAERRIGRAERLAGATVLEAAAALEDAGGLATVERLPTALDADATALRALAARAERLADRAEAADVPVDALRRLA